MHGRFEGTSREGKKSYEKTPTKSPERRDLTLSDGGQKQLREATSGRDSLPSSSIQTREAISEDMALVVTDYSASKLANSLWNSKPLFQVTKMLADAFTKARIENVPNVAKLHYPNYKDCIQALDYRNNKVTAQQLDIIRRDLELKLDTTPPNPEVATHIQKWIQGLKFALMGELINSGSDTQQERYRNKEVPSVRWSQGIILAGSGTEPIQTPQRTSGDIKEYEVDYSHVSGTLLEEVRYTSQGAIVATLSYLDKALENLRESEHKNTEVYILSENGPFDAEDYRIKQFALKWQEVLGEKLVIKSLYKRKPKDTNNTLFCGKCIGHKGRKKEATKIVTLRNTTIYEEGYALPGLSPFPG